MADIEEPECPMGIGIPYTHEFMSDPDDRRFKYCKWCGKVKYRTDEELLEAAKKQQEEDDDGA